MVSELHFLFLPLKRTFFLLGNSRFESAEQYNLLLLLHPTLFSQGTYHPVFEGTFFNLQRYRHPFQCL